MPTSENPNHHRTALVAYWSIIIALVLVLLHVGRALMIPLAIAVVIWFLIATLSHDIRSLRVFGRQIPGWLAMTLSVLVITAVLYGIASLITTNVAGLSGAAPRYQQNLERIMAELPAKLGIEQLPEYRRFTEQLNVRSVVVAIASALSELVGNAGLILIYVAFLLAEQKLFGLKLRAFYKDPEKRAEIQELLQVVSRQSETYVRIKIITSLMTGAISYGILKFVGVDFAGFWALIIFLLNFIPTIGSLLGVIFPAVLTLVQFAEFGPFIIVTGALGITQVVIGNVVEPAMMGRSLNLSPLVIMVSLSVWGALWGVVGMFLSVPFMVIALIVFSHFPSTRPIAVLLSGDGEIVETVGRNRQKAT